MHETKEVEMAPETSAGVDTSWSDLIQLDEAGRGEQMSSRFSELLKMEEGERLATLGPMVKAEYELPPESLYLFTRSRLRSWVAIASDNPSGAHQIARGYDQIFGQLPGGMAMRRVEVVQHASRDMTSGELETLGTLIPAILNAIAPKAAVAALPPTEPGRGKKKFWKF